MPFPTALYSTSEIRSIEHAAQAALPAGTLMQRAGEAAARFAMELLGDVARTSRALVLAGPGNNGGDGFEAVYRLSHAGFDVTVLLCGDTSRLPVDAATAFQRIQTSSIHFAPLADWKNVAAEPWQLVIDGLFGIGLTRPISGTLRDLVEHVNRLPCPVLALDVPSGLDADTGNIVGGAAGIAIEATHTITFIGDKPGLHTADGQDYAGIVRVSSLNINESLFPPYRSELNGPHLFASQLEKRRHNTHKGSFGDVFIIGGAHGMSGAVILSARAAAKCGAGRVFAAFLDEAPLYDSTNPELMCRQAASVDLSRGVLVVGPGLGVSPSARDILERALAAQTPLVLDADALNLIAADSALQALAARHALPMVMTPHPLEAARLLGTTSSDIQNDRLASARALAVRFQCTVVLKGSGTVIATPNHSTVINTTGNPALATAGTGDVLAGMCGALLAQAWPARETALVAVWLHGQAADCLVANGIGPVGMTASDLLPEIRKSLNTLIAQYAQPPLPS